jgi:hypothetical protein
MLHGTFRLLVNYITMNVPTISQRRTSVVPTHQSVGSWLTAHCTPSDHPTVCWLDYCALAHTLRSVCCKWLFTHMLTSSILVHNPCHVSDVVFQHFLQPRSTSCFSTRGAACLSQIQQMLAKFPQEVHGYAYVAMSLAGSLVLGAAIYGTSTWVA